MKTILKHGGTSRVLGGSVKATFAGKVRTLLRGVIFDDTPVTPTGDFRLLENGDTRALENGDLRVLE